MVVRVFSGVPVLTFFQDCNRVTNTRRIVLRACSEKDLRHDWLKKTYSCLKIGTTATGATGSSEQQRLPFLFRHAPVTF